MIRTFIQFLEVINEKSSARTHKGPFGPLFFNHKVTKFNLIIEGEIAL